MIVPYSAFLCGLATWRETYPLNGAGSRKDAKAQRIAK